MNAQGSQIINLQYFESLTSAVQAAQSCESLQALVSKAMASLSALKAGADAEIAAIQPIRALLTAPASNPAAIVTWLNNFITLFLEPYVAPIVSYEDQLAALSTQVGLLTSAVATKQAEFALCEIAIPPL